ncbi:hypothetical protein [Actinoallomurus iriomotensis]|nr:hypothetical protein [Actinoallomurus iriomotensis]
MTGVGAVDGGDELAHRRARALVAVGAVHVLERRPPVVAVG